MKVIIAPDPRLRVKTKPVKKINSVHLKTVREMVKVAQSFQDPEGVGLASNQIGEKERFFVGKINKKFQVFFNPKILSASKKTRTFFEGCLSIPNFWGAIKRPVVVTVSYQNKDGREITQTLKGQSAWIFQHEVDHLNGVLFIDRVLEQKGKIYKFTGKDRAGADIFEEVTLL